MKKTNSNLMLLGMLFAAALITSNMIAAKTVYTGIPLFGTIIIIPCAVLCYPITFLVTDVVGEIWGKAEARAIVRWGFICQVAATCLVVIAQHLPAANPDMQAAYVTVLGQNTVFVIASLSAYLVAQTWDVWVFHRIRDHFISKPDGARHRWIWNNGSTMTSQVFDTLIFIGIAFGLGFGMLFDPVSRVQLLAMMVGQYLCKFILAAIDTPFFYLLTRRSSSIRSVDERS